MKTQTTGTTTTTNDDHDDRVTIPVLMSPEMKTAIVAHAEKLGVTTMKYIRDLVGADINWDMSHESRKPRTRKYATVEEQRAAQRARDKKLRDEFSAWRKSQKMANAKPAENKTGGKTTARKSTPRKNGPVIVKKTGTKTTTE